MFIFLLLFLISSHKCDRFAKEELGVADRLRFTSGRYGYYNCTIHNNMVYSNLKIGIYIYNQKTELHFHIDSDFFILETKRVENFYFAFISLKKNSKLKNSSQVKLSAYFKNNKKILVDKTWLKFSESDMVSARPSIVAPDKTIIKIYDDTLIASVIGTIQKKEKLSNKLIFSMSTSYLEAISEFAVTTDGRILLTKQLKSTKKSFYNFDVEVKYSGSSLSKNVTVVVNVLPRIENVKHQKKLKIHRHYEEHKPTTSTPKPELTSYKFVLSEFAPKYTIVGKISYSQKISEKVQYVITVGNENNTFDLNPISGVLSVSRDNQIDFENKTKYDLSISATIGYMKILDALVTIEVIDENDNAPTFSSNEYTFHVSEDAMVGHSITFLHATDKDSNNNGVVYYALLNSDKLPFKVSSDGVIKLSQKIDILNMPKEFVLYIHAFDAGTPIRQETKIIVTIIVDILNTHKPVMKQISCTLMLTDKQSENETLISFRALDEDIYDNILYKMIESNEQFVLNETSGNLRFHRKTLGEMILSGDILYVYAFDGAHKSLEVTVTVSYYATSRYISCYENKNYINIEEKLEKSKFKRVVKINNLLITPHPEPALSFSSKMKNSLRVSEDAPIGQKIFEVSMSIPDLNKQKVILFTITAGNDDGHFQIGLMSGCVYVFASLDREKNDGYKIMIKAQDLFGQSVSHQLFISINDVNDNSPMFSSNGYYNFKVQEGKPKGYPLGLVSAKDSDLGSNGEVEYSFISNSELFSINKQSGLISLNMDLPLGKLTQYTIDVLAKDKSVDAQLVSYATVSISVTGLSNHIPICLVNHQKIEIPSNTPAGVIVGRIFGYDLDTGDAGKLSYVIKSKVPASLHDYFSLHPDTGLIKLRKSLTKKDKGRTFNVEVLLKDHGTPQLYTTCHVYKIVVDELTSIAPSIHLNSRYFEFDISSGILAGHIVKRLETFIKKPENSRYHIVDGDGIGFFEVDEVVGTLVTVSTIFLKAFYWLTIQIYVRDSNYFQNIHVLIKLQQQTSSQPYFYPSVYRWRLPFSNKKVREVGQVFAKDQINSFSTDFMKFSIYAGNDQNYFLIKNDGVVYAQNIVKEGHYELNITVSTENNLHSFGSIYILVVDDAMSKPQFNFDGAINVFEPLTNVKAPFLFQILAETKRRDEFFKYEIDEDSIFQIDSHTGAVTSNSTLRQGDLNLVDVTISNSAGKESLTIFVEVVGPPKEDSRLKFLKTSYKFSVKENVVDYIIHDFKKDLVNIGNNLVQFFIANGNEELQFYFPPSQLSVLKIVKPLDYEVATSHTLDIIAFDGRASIKARVIISVINMNDNILAASQACFDARITENSIPENSLITVKVSDADRQMEEDYYERIPYGLINDPYNKSPFEVSGKGVISVKRDIRFDREIQSEYVVTVVAGSTGENTTYCVRVVIEDENDNSPQFTKSLYEVDILDSTPVGSSIIAVYASDPDEGRNSQLSYSFVSNPEYFEIDQKSGIVYVSKPLKLINGEQKAIVDVQVKDNGKVEKKDNSRIEISVIPDLYGVLFRKERFEASVMEEMPIGTLVTSSVKVNKSAVNYQIDKLSEDCFKMFWIDTFTGIILTKTVFNADELSNCTFRVVGMINTAQVTSTIVFVSIEDYNDPPVFKHLLYTGVITEGVLVNSPVIDVSTGGALKVEANDYDLKENGMVKYTFVEDYVQAYFAINELTGVIVTNDVLDYEKHPTSFVFHVAAYDQGVQRLFSKVMVKINVTNVNDRVPIFDNEHYSFSLILPAFTGTCIGTLTANDGDTGSTKFLEYSLLSGINWFHINSVSGEICVHNSDIDEHMTPLPMKASVSDGLYTAITNIDVQLMNYQAEKVFKFRSPIQNASTQENQMGPLTFLLVNPTGYHLGNQLYFELLNFQSFFSIDKNMGVISSKALAFDRELTPYFPLQVQCQIIGAPLWNVARVLVNVSILDENDNAPIFLQPKYYKAVDVNTEEKHVLTVTAVDEDAGINSDISFSIHPLQEYFECDEKTGVITLTKSFIKSEARPKYVFNIRASDHGLKPMVSETTVTIIVVNKDQPLISQNYQVSIREDIQDGDKIVDIVAVGRNNRQVYYEIGEGDRYKQFHIGFTSGELNVFGKLNHSAHARYNLSIRAIDSLTGSWSYTECNIAIVDVNDHVPIFQQAFYEVSVQEDSAIGSFVVNVHATDADSGRNAKISYVLSETSDEKSLFSLETESGKITLKKKLDAEEKDVHYLHVIAKDDGKVVKSSSTIVKVVVIDVNDNTPVAKHKKLKFFVDMVNTSKQFIGKVDAYDADLKYKLTYEFKEHTNYMQVNQMTGIITLKRRPSPSLTLRNRVVVSDGKNEIFVEIEVHVNVRNEKKPIIRSVINVSLKEDRQSKKRFLTDLAASDPDMGRYSKLSYQIDSQRLRRYFRVSKRGLVFTTKLSFDREKTDTFIVPVRVTDGGGLFALTQLIVKIIDENDNTPMFEFPRYRTNVMTSQMYEESLLHVSANDLDEGINADLTYNTHGLAVGGSPLSIGSKSGLISLAGNPRGLKYQFSIQTSDNGYPVRQSRADVEIFVKSWNKKNLFFPNNSYSFEVNEDVDPPKVLYTLKATLLEYKGLIYYKFAPGNWPYTSAEENFRLDETSGEIQLIKPLDYERVRNYKFMVYAYTNRHTDEFATAFVYIKVRNINDDVPKFDSKVYSFNISESVEIGDQLLCLTAVDHDVNEHGDDKLTYYIVDGDEDVLSLNSTTGWLSVKNKIDREVKSKLKVKVAVKDMIGQSDEALIEINVIDVNDTPPKFKNKYYSITISEDTPLQDMILKAEASDADEGSHVEFYVANITPEYCFTVNRDSGEIRLSRRLQGHISFNMTLIAYDGTHVSYSYININVRDINDHWPVCLQSFYNIYMEENSRVNTEVTRIVALDDDSTDSLTYQIQEDRRGKFQIDRNTGFITTADELDYESEARHEFKVIVKDNADHICACDVLINVLDVNDNPPLFLHDSYTTTIRENASDSSVVIQVEAHDRDSYENGQVIYTLLNGDGAFRINDQGVVTVKNRNIITQRSSSTFSMTVLAKDNGTVPLESSTKLEVIVLSHDDTPPQFVKLGYLFNVSENNEKNIKLGRVTVESSANLKSQKIEVTVINDESNSFEIDENFNLKARVSFDYEVRHQYLFSLKAWFVGIPTLSTVVNVEVQINDVNDNPPAFVKKQYTIEIDENIRDGTFVLQALAHDKDGSNENSMISYYMMKNENVPFALDEQKATITVNGIVDYESEKLYEFYLYARDSGTPRLQTKVKVKITVNDLNDNQPMVSEHNTTVIIQDSKPANSTVIRMKITDSDSAKNAGPFKCSMFDGDRDKFDVKETEDDVCIIETKQKFEVTTEEEFVLRVRVKDSGSPQQYSDSEFRVIVVQESYHPPVIQDPKVFYVIVSKPYVVTKIGRVKVFDKDTNDIHKYEIASGNEEGYFTIQDMGGVVEGKAPKGSYTLSIEVNDGKYSDSSIFRVIVNELDEGIIYNSVSLSLQDMGSRYFIQSKLVKFNEILAKILGVSLEDVFVWSVVDSNSVGRNRRDTLGTATVALAVNDPFKKGSYLRPSTLEESVKLNLDKFKKFGIALSVSSTTCSYEAVCMTYQRCVVTMTPKETNNPHLPSGYMDFVGGESCICNEGFRGDDCSLKKFCTSNPCKPGHRCVETASSYICECTDEAQCKQGLIATFNGESYIKYQLSRSFESLFDKLELYFRTESLRPATIFDASGKDSFRIEIKSGGHIQCGFDFGGGFRSINFNDVSLDVTDGNWHHVSIVRHGDFVSMEIDHKHKDFITGEGDHTKININDELNIVFGARLVAGEVVNSFQGCLKDIRLHGKPLRFDDEQNDIVKKVTAHKIQSGCRDSGLCSTKHCPSFSSCSNTLSGYSCTCLPGHYGKACTSEMTCDDKPCRNGGKCTLEQMNDDVTYKCACPNQFTGAQCQINLQACASNPCLNNGHCIPYGTDSFTCACPDGITGDKCQTNLNPCASSPCRNGGTCLNFHGDFKCGCLPGYAGRQCSRGENCNYVNCENGGVCQEIQDSAICKCPRGYTGRICQEDLNECLSNDKCGTPNTCINTYGSFYCNCSTGSTGSSCALVSQSAKDEPPFILIGAGGGGLLLLLIIIFVIICLVKRRNRHKQKEGFVYTPGKRSVDCEMSNLFVPTPPLRGIAMAPKYDESDQASAAMYDPSLINMSGASSPDEFIKMKFSPSKTSLEYQSDEEEKMPGYHWDYTEVPLDLLNTQMSREGSRIGLSKTDQCQYYEDDDDLHDQLYVDIPQIPERPASRRSSIPTCTDCDSEIPKIPELPQQIRQSRNSLGNTADSSPTYPDRLPDLSSKEFSHRFSLLSNNESDITNVTKLYQRADMRSEASDLSDELDGLTETSLNSDDEDIREDDPLDTRKLERDIKKLFKDLQKRTEEDL